MNEDAVAISSAVDEEIISLDSEAVVETVESVEVSTDTDAVVVSAFSKPFSEYSVSEFLLLLLLILSIINTVLGLFLRKWGFVDW